MTKMDLILFLKGYKGFSLIQVIKIKKRLHSVSHLVQTFFRNAVLYIIRQTESVYDPIYSNYLTVCVSLRKSEIHWNALVLGGL